MNELIEAVLTGGFEEVKRLIEEEGEDVNAGTPFGTLREETPGIIRGVTPLFAASQTGSLEIVRLLLQHHADVNQANSGGATPLLKASHRGNLAVVKELVTNGADVDKSNNKGVTPLFIASREGHLGVMFHLLINGAVIPENNVLSPDTNDVSRAMISWLRDAEGDFASEMGDDLRLTAELFPEAYALLRESIEERLNEEG